MYALTRNYKIVELLFHGSFVLHHTTPTHTDTLPTSLLPSLCQGSHTCVNACLCAVGWGGGEGAGDDIHPRLHPRYGRNVATRRSIRRYGRAGDTPKPVLFGPSMYGTHTVFPFPASLLTGISKTERRRKKAFKGQEILPYRQIPV